MRNFIPNFLTILRLVLSLATFAALIAMGAEERGAPIPDPIAIALVWFSLAAFVVAAVTDFFDGWLARRWGVVSITGTILDPIADKVLVCGAIVGLLALRMPNGFVFAALGGLILMREFAISALREVLAPRGLTLPVSFLAKTKTTLQLVALGAIMILAFWPVWGVQIPIEQLVKAWTVAEGLFALATVVTLWTGVQYARTAFRALTTSPAPAGPRAKG